MEKRIEWVDAAKGIGLLLVIIGHLQVPYVSTWIYFFHMPLFFFLSGMVYTGSKYSFKEFLFKRILSLILPYFTFGTIILLFYTILNCFIGAENGQYGTCIDMIKGLIAQEHFWTIWFLTALFLVEIIYYFLDMFFRKKRYFLHITTFIICFWGLVRYRIGLGALPWNLDIALVAQFFYHVGRVFRESKFLSYITKYQNYRKPIILLIIFFVVNILSGVLGIKISHESLDMSVGLYGNEILTFISAFSGIFFVIIISKLFPLNGLQYLGKNTMVIFALHSRVIIVLCEYIYEAIGILQGNSLIERLLYVAITFIAILVVLIPITELIKKSKIHILFGV